MPMSPDDIKKFAKKFRDKNMAAMPPEKEEPDEAPEPAEPKGESDNAIKVSICIPRG